ncbi:protein S100-A16-like [Conger conger]|uniref:protein S100-A16-like n=1 Tax=Conger conger TaxID=82655 RepID=UPI002A5A18EB|nr:protein S100-A16-like [Conger conger]XP_061111817.1 protein S100-A16-like [Conger conger]XP_061111818.1 protein S100-A16-like [Conger conger]
MESAIETVVEVYLKFAGTKENLSLNAFQRMVREQLGNIMTDTDSSGGIEDVFRRLDANHDGKLSFPEYMTLVGYLANTHSEGKVKDQEAAGGAPAAQEIQ